MAAITYSNPRAYIDSAQDACDRLLRVEALIDSLIDAATRAALGEEISEYNLDDGQTKIRSVSRSVSEITKSIDDLMRLKNLLKKQINGHITQLKDHQALRGL